MLQINWKAPPLLRHGLLVGACCCVPPCVSASHSSSFSLLFSAEMWTENESEPQRSGQGGGERAGGGVWPDLQTFTSARKKGEGYRQEIKNYESFWNAKLSENNASAVETSLQRRVQCMTFLLMSNKSSVVRGSERKQGDGCVRSIFDITLESAGASILLNGPVREVSHH